MATLHTDLDPTAFADRFKFAADLKVGDRISVTTVDQRRGAVPAYAEDWAPETWTLASVQETRLHGRPAVVVQQQDDIIAMRLAADQVVPLEGYYLQYDPNTPSVMTGIEPVIAISDYSEIAYDDLTDQERHLVWLLENPFKEDGTARDFTIFVEWDGGSYFYPAEELGIHETREEYFFTNFRIRADPYTIAKWVIRQLPTEGDLGERRARALAVAMIAIERVRASYRIAREEALIEARRLFEIDKDRIETAARRRDACWRPPAPRSDQRRSRRPAPVVKT
jgi:hypothetical protein